MGKSGHLSFVLRVLIVAILYAAIGKLALSLTIAGGYSAAIWPGAGIALGAVLVWGPRMLAGVFIGSMLVYLDFTVWINSQGIVHSVVYALFLLTGSVMQPVVGWLLIRKFVGLRDPLIRDEKIIRFLVLGGPVTALVSASCGTVVLRFYDKISSDSAAVSWFTWWVGDTIGILIFTPLFLMLTGQPRAIWRSRIFSVGLPMCIAFAVALVLFFATGNIEKLTNYRMQERRSNALVRAFETRWKSAEVVARSVASFFASSKHVSPDEFKGFVGSLTHDQRGIQAISWIQYVRDEHRDAFETYWRRRGYHDFKITEVSSDQDPTLVPAGRREDYLVATMIEPLRGNASAIGMDSASRSASRPAQRHARDTGLPSVTGSLMLVQEPQEQFGILMFLPVYRGPADTIDQRRENLYGYAVGVFLIDDLLNSAMEGMDRTGIAIDLFDESVEPPARQSLLKKNIASNAEHTLTFDRVLRVADRRWTIRTTVDLGHAKGFQTMQSWTVLTSGVMFTSLLGGFLMILTGRAARVESLVDDRTSELSDTNQKLEIATRAKGEFLANMSHEIRTPMTAILGFVDLLAQDRLKNFAQKREAFKTVRRNGEHLMTIINDILDLSKIEAGKLDLEQIPIDPAALVRDVMLTFGTIAGDKKLKLRVSCEPQSIPVILGDPVRFRQILMNLLSNAIKFTDQGEVAATMCWDDATRTLTTEVSDTGIGISPEQMLHMFKPFVQGDSATARKYGGAGLGLRISRRLSDMMGGLLEVRHREGGGAIFTLTLPDRNVAVLPVDESPEGDNQFMLKSLEGRHVLIIDDGADNRLLISMLLRHMGAQTTTHGGAEELLVQMQTDPTALDAYDLVIMDMQMPEIDGPEAVRQLRQLGVGVPIIAISANVLETDRQRCIDAGYDDFLTKPIDQHELLSACRKWLPGAILPDI